MRCLTARGESWQSDLESERVNHSRSICLYRHLSLNAMSFLFVMRHSKTFTEGFFVDSLVSRLFSFSLVSSRCEAGLYACSPVFFLVPKKASTTFLSVCQWHPWDVSSHVCQTEHWSLNLKSKEHSSVDPFLFWAILQRLWYLRVPLVLKKPFMYMFVFHHSSCHSSYSRAVSLSLSSPSSQLYAYTLKVSVLFLLLTPYVKLVFISHCCCVQKNFISIQL